MHFSLRKDIKFKIYDVFFLMVEILISTLNIYY